MIFVQITLIGLVNGAIIGLSALAVSLVYAVVRSINLAHGDVFALLSVLAAMGVHASGITDTSAALSKIGLIIALSSGVGLAGVLAYSVLERLAFRPFYGRSTIAPLVTTMAASFVLYQLALFTRTLTNAVIPGEHRSVPGIPEIPRIRIAEVLPTGNLIATTTNWQLRVHGKDVVVLGVVAIITVWSVWLVYRSRFGRAIRACASDPDMAQLCGISPQRIRSQVWALGGLLTGLAATLHTLYYTHPATQYGIQSGLIAFAAVILGGVGRPHGAVLSGLAFGVISAWCDYWWAARWTPLLLMGLLVGLLLLRSLPRVGERRQELFQPTKGSGYRGLLWLIPLIGLAAWNTASSHSLLITMCIAWAMALGLQLIFLRAGIVDLGFAAYMAVGAYATALLNQPYSALYLPWGWLHETPIVLLASALIASVLGIWHGLLAQRLQAEALAIATLASSLVLPLILVNAGAITNGAGGISAIPGPQIAGSIQRQLAPKMVVAGVSVCVIAFALYQIMHSRYGRAWDAVRMQPEVAESLGVPTARLRWLAFVLGAGCGGIAGSLYASTWSFVHPELASVQATALIFAIVILGQGNVWNILGATIGVILYDRILIPQGSAWLVEHQAAGLGRWLDLRNINFLAFGVLLYFSIIWKTRRPTGWATHFLRRSTHVSTTDSSAS